MKHFFALLLLSIAAQAGAQTYWQQRVDTRLDVTLDDKKHFLHGSEEITYTNNSPDTLSYIYIHLWPNAYLHDRTQFAEQMAENGETDFYYAKPSQRGYIDSLEFRVDGKSVEHYSQQNMPDIARIDLPAPLAPGQQIKITTPFRVKIPNVFSRLGHTKQAYFISQWYPKPAVYDKKGWHPLPYLNYGEFYSEIGSYDVSITLPDNYVVMATGNCTDKSENDWLDSIARKEPPSDTLYKNTWPASSATVKTIHFHEDNVHDFAWFADKRWIVRKAKFKPSVGDSVTAYTAFLPQRKKQWLSGLHYLREAVELYGKEVGPYPYKTIKAIEGDMSAGGGMEYPTITVIDRIAAGMLETVIVHEAGHNWFYGILASNERDHAWMDEGLNTFYEQKTLAAKWKYDTTTRAIWQDTAKKFKDPSKSLSMDKDAEEIIYIHETIVREDQPLELTSARFTEANYGIDVYYKTAAMLRWLEQYMGEDNFRAGMNDYYNTWKHKHPYPEDFKASMQRHTDKPVDWFFNDILHTDKPIDFKIADVDNGSEVTVRNRTGLTVPVGLHVYKKDSLLGKIWSQPFEGETTLTLPESMRDWTAIRVSQQIPESKRQNSVYRRRGFHRSGFQLRPLAGISYGEKQKMFVAPALGYNMYDGFELGLVFHNLSLPQKRFQYVLAPMYGFKSENFIGAGSVGYSWYSDGLFKEIAAQVDAKSFHYNATQQNITEPLVARYLKIAPSLTFRFNEHDLRSPVTRTITLKAYDIMEDQFQFSMDPADSLFKPAIVQQEKLYGLIRYKHKNDRTFNPFSYGAEVQLNKDFVKISAEGKLRIDYFKKNKSLRVRGYLGRFITINNTPDISRYYLNTTYTGANDYLYDGTYFGRSEQSGFASRQISIIEGGFKVPTPLYASPLGRSDAWLAAANISTDLPFGKLPLRLFLDVGTFTNAAQLNPSGQKILYDGGVEVALPFDIVSVYFVLVRSKDFNDYIKSIYGNKVFGNSIVFKMDLNKLNWMKATNTALKFMGL